VLSAKRRHEWTILSHVSCFVEGEVERQQKLAEQHLMLVYHWYNKFVLLCCVANVI